MKKNILILLLVLSALLWKFDATAQHQCGSGHLHQHKMTSDLAYAHTFSVKQIEMAELQQAGFAQNLLSTIPVVIHVIHLGEEEGSGTNISDAQIFAAMQGANERFSNTIGMGADTEIQFCLATRDPSGCPTNGIVRIDGTVLPNYAGSGIDYPDDVDCGAAPDLDVKALSTWPVLDYYNIWVVNTICEGWAGYAYYPNGQYYDGTVIRYDYITYSSTALSHELGHAFYLAHTFNGDNGNADCPLNDNCQFEGDYVCDTPPHKQGDCDATNPCTTDGVWDNSRFNYMSYCGSTDRFTSGQKDRMQTTLQTFPRENLLNSLGCSSPDFGTITTTVEVNCEGECTGTITAQPQCPGNYTYQWNTGDTSPTITGLCPGSYSVNITDDENLEVTFEVELSPPPTFEFYADTLFSICAGQEVQLEASGAQNYQWSPAINLSDANIANPVAEPDATTTYQVIGHSAFGCLDSTYVTVEVFENPVASITQVVDTLFAQPAGLSYQWFNNGTLIENEFLDYIVLTDDGEFTVVVTDENECSNESEIFYYVNISEPTNAGGTALFPNPNHGSFALMINALHPQEMLVDLYDYTGKIVYSINTFVPGGESAIGFQLAHLAQGIYLLQARSDDGIFSGKFTIVQ